MTENLQFHLITLTYKCNGNRDTKLHSAYIILHRTSPQSFRPTLVVKYVLTLD